MPNQGMLSEIRRMVDTKRRTIFELGFYLILVGVGSVFVLDLLRYAWTHQPWGVIHVLFNFIIDVLGIEKPTFYYLPTGLLLGIMGVLLLDSYKRAQGLILWSGMVLGAFWVLWDEYLLIGPLIDGFKPFAAVLGVFGILLGLRLGGVRGELVTESNPRWEFPEAPRRLFLLALFIVVYGMFEAVLVYEITMGATSDGFVVQELGIEGISLTADILGNSVMSTLGLLGLYKFTSYESHTKMILIGPQRSGKSALFGGLQLAVRDLLDDQAGIKSNSHVTRLSDEIATGSFPEATVREEPTPLEINYRSDGLFPEKKTIQSVDYAGELLPEILEPVIQDPARSDGGQIAEEVEKEEEDESNDGPSLSDIVGDDSDEDTPAQPGSAENWEEATRQIYETDQAGAPAAIWDCIRHSDRVIMTIPMDDFITPIINRRNWPSYQPIEIFDEGQTVQELRDEYDIPYEANLHSFGDGYYYYTDEPDRASPAKYLSWYRDLAREFRDEKEFVLIVTMADWAIEDFERENPRGLNPRIKRNYPDFCRYAYEEILLQENVNVQDLFAAADDDNIHLLWYPIENDRPPEGDEEYRIDTSTVDALQDNRQTLLNGAKELIRRLNR